MKKNTLLVLALLIIVVISLLGYKFYKNKISLSSGQQPVEKIVTKTLTSDKKGTYLTDINGLTLYIFSPNPTTESACDYQCLKSWKPFIPDFAYGTDDNFNTQNYNVGDKITIIKRADGLYQYAYDGKLLYKFVGDIKPNDTNGLNVSNKNWKLINL